MIYNYDCYNAQTLLMMLVISILALSKAVAISYWYEAPLGVYQYQISSKSI
jgi:hypothetical protein